MEDDFKEFYDLIEENYNIKADDPEKSDRSEAAIKILKYKSRIEYLGFLQQYLLKYSELAQHLRLTFSYMKEIVKLRGCLMAPEELIEHFKFLRQFIIDNHQLLLSNRICIESASQDLAYTIRIVIEKDPEVGNALVDEIKNFFDSEGNLRVVSLYLMISLVDCFKEELSHNTFSENTDYKKKFEQYILNKFTDVLFLLIFQESGQTLSSALELLLHCFEFCENPNKETLSNNIYPIFFAPYFIVKADDKEPTILKRIFELCFDQNEEISSLSYRILIYMASASSVWESISNKIDYFNFFSISMIQVIKSQDGSSKNIGQTCAILNLLGKNLDGEQFLQIDNQIVHDFFDSCLGFSVVVFNVCEPSSLHNLFVFWSKISDWKTGVDFTDLLYQLIVNFIETSLEAILQNSEDWEALFDTEYSEKFESIWKIAHSCYERIYELVVEKIKSIAEGEVNLLQLTFLITIVSSRFGNIRCSNNEEQKEFDMYKVIISLIDTTNSRIKDIFAGDKNAIIFENSLIIFMTKYQKSHFLGSKNAIRMSEEEKNAEQENIEVFVSHILNVFDLFSFIADHKDTVERLFALVDFIVKKDECLKMIEKTPIKEALFTQSLSIQFEGVPPEIAKRPRIKLYYLYTSLIKTVRDLQEFLGKFDERFKEIASSNYENRDEEIFALFCDLRGVFKYLIRNINQPTTDNIKKKYVRVCNWFLTEHDQDSIEIIKNNASKTIIVNIVCNVWITLFPDRFDQQANSRNPTSSIIDNFDGFGIILFKTCLNIAGSVCENCENDFPKFTILIKVVRYCLTTKYTNFGVMSYYKDDSFDQMKDRIFFSMLESIEFDDLIKYVQETNSLNVLNNILLTMSAIAESENCLKELFENQDHLKIVAVFTAKCMSLDSHNREVPTNESKRKIFGSAQIREKKDVTFRDLWSSAWNVIQPMLDKIMITPDLKDAVQLFRPHSVLIINSAMMKYDKKELLLSPILLASCIHDAPFIQSLLNLIIGTYDERFQEFVKDQLMALFKEPEEPIVETFMKRLETFSLNFKKYHSDFIDVPDVAKLL